MGHKNLPHGLIDPYLFGNAHCEEFDLYWIITPEGAVSKVNRKLLKSMGWMLQRHSRTNEEIWIFNKDQNEKL